MLPNPIIQFNIGSFPVKVHMYGIMIALGILALFIVLFLYSKKLGIDPSFTDFVYYNALIAIAVGFGSASLFQSVYDFIQNPEAGFKISNGITFIGGLIGGVVSFLIGYAIFRKRLKGRLIDSLSIIPCCITLGHGFGRIGCFFAGCCYGAATKSPLGVLFVEPTQGTLREQYPDWPTGELIHVHPTQLYEAAFLFVLFAVLTVLVLKYKFRHNMSIYLIAYGIFRFSIEYLRADDRGQLVVGISPSQFWSLCMIAAGIGLVFLMNFLYKRRELEIEIVEIEEETNE